MNNNNIRPICLVTNHGGHLYQLTLIASAWKKYPHFYIVEDGVDTRSLLKGETLYVAHAPTQRSIVNAIRNFFLGMYIILKNHPRLLISCGAGIAPPIFLAGKLLGCKLLFIDSYTFIKKPSLSAQLVAFFADRVCTQHEHIAKKNTGFSYWGGLL